MTQRDRGQELESMLRTLTALNASLPPDREPVVAGGDSIELSVLEKQILVVMEWLIAERRAASVPDPNREEQRKHCLHDHLEAVCARWWAPAAASFRISKQLARIRRLGLIQQITVKGDARQRAWGLTAKGEEFARQLHQRRIEILSHSLEEMSASEIQACHTALARLAGAAWERLKGDAGLVKQSASTRS